MLYTNQANTNRARNRSQYHETVHSFYIERCSTWPPAQSIRKVWHDTKPVTTEGRISESMAPKASQIASFSLTKVIGELQ